MAGVYPESASIRLAHAACTDGPLPLWYAARGKSGPALVIVPSAFGVAADLQAQMLELAASAACVACLDPIFRNVPGVIPYTDMASVMARLSTLDAARLYDDLQAAIAWARVQPGVTGVYVLGICFGGPYALKAAIDRIVDGAATWHGTRMQDHLAGAAAIRCPLRLHFGDRDPFVPSAAVDAIRAALPSGIDAQVVVHAGATHGFTHRGAPAAYQPAAEQAAMQAVQALLAAGGGR